MPRSIPCCSAANESADSGTSPRSSGFTLVELMIVTVVMAVVAGFALPTLASVNLAGNESAVFATLRTIFTAQGQVRSAALIDSDRNGAGEYGFFQELTGVRSLRFDSDSDGIADADGSANLQPPAITSAFAEVDAAGLVQRSGYLFRIYLPKVDCGWQAEPGPASPYVGVSAFQAASHWACYAWPVAHEKTGRRAFFINQSGRILACDNHLSRYSGAGTAPSPDAVLVSGGGGKMSGPLAMNAVGTDGNTWVIVQ